MKMMCIASQRTCANYALLIRLVLIFSALPGLSYGQTISIFDDFLRRYEAAPVSAKAQLMQSFIDRQRKSGGFPITEADGTVIFVYVGASGERDVRLTGDFRQKSFSDVYWDTVGEPMARVGSLFYYRQKFETDALLDYKFIVDGKDLRDPLNARTIVSGTGGGEVSELVMPRHSSFSTATTQDGAAHGTLHVLEEAWAKPKVTIYMPPGYDSSSKYSAVYTADGSAWLDFLKFPTILDNLINSHSIEPVIAVMIDAAADRSAWYSYNADYLSYLQRVVQYVDTHYATRARPDSRLHAGTSAGGRATAYVGFELPTVFGKLAMLSGGLNTQDTYWASYLSGQKDPPSTLHIWMSAGSYEGSIYENSRAIQAYLEQAGIPTIAVYAHHGHSFGAWRERASEMMQHFFPARR